MAVEIALSSDFCRESLLGVPFVRDRSPCRIVRRQFLSWRNTDELEVFLDEVRVPCSDPDLRCGMISCSGSRSAVITCRKFSLEVNFIHLEEGFHSVIHQGPRCCLTYHCRCPSSFYCLHPLSLHNSTYSINSSVAIINNTNNKPAV